jgi:hypothetical protein
MNTPATLKFDQLQRIANLFPVGESVSMSEVVALLHQAKIYDTNLCLSDLAGARFIVNPGGPRGTIKRLPDPPRPKEASSPYWRPGDPVPENEYTFCSGPLSGQTCKVSELDDFRTRSHRQQETARVARLKTDLAAVGLLP